MISDLGYFFEGWIRARYEMFFRNTSLKMNFSESLGVPYHKVEFHGGSGSVLAIRNSRCFDVFGMFYMGPPGWQQGIPSGPLTPLISAHVWCRSACPGLVGFLSEFCQSCRLILFNYIVNSLHKTSQQPSHILGYKHTKTKGYCYNHRPFYFVGL